VDRKDVYRRTTAMGDQCLAGEAEPPAAIVLDLDHSAAPTYGQPECAFYPHHYQHHCSLPLFVVDGTSQALVTAYLRPGTRPPGAENALIFVRRVSYLRRRWPSTHILVRGDSPWAPPEVLDVIAAYRWTDFVCGLAGHAVLLRQAAAPRQAARRRHHQRVALASTPGPPPPPSSRLYDEFVSAAQSWTPPWRVVLKAEGMQADANPRFVVTSLAAPTPQMLYENLYCARGNGANAIKAVQHALRSDRPSATSCLANAMRLLLACAAYVLPQA
jgi:hypothetical protein